MLLWIWRTSFAIPRAEVDTVETVSAGTKTTSLYTVQFTDSSNAGKQNTHKCDTIDSADVNGAMPQYGKVDVCGAHNVDASEWFDESGQKSHWIFSGDGFTTTGLIDRSCESDILSATDKTKLRFRTWHGRQCACESLTLKRIRANALTTLAQTA